jgi:hypothetical protein
MGRSVSSIIGVAALGGGLAAGLSVLVVLAVVWLVVIAFANAIRLLGALLDSVEAGGRPFADDGAPIDRL